MSDISARPWKIDYDNIFDANGEKILGLCEWIAQDVCHMVNCVNEYDRLELCVNILIVQRDEALAEVEKLKNAYKKHVANHYFCDTCGNNIISDSHKPNCDYIKMIGGVE